MPARQLARDRQAETGAVTPGRTGECLEEVVTRLGRQARASVDDLDHGITVLAAPAHGQLAFALMPIQRLNGIAAQIEKEPVHLIRVGIELERWRNLIGPGQSLVLAGVHHDIIQQRPRRHCLALGRGFLGASELQRGFTQANAPVDRPHQALPHPAHALIAVHGQPVRDKMRRGQHIAQIVVDLRHGAAQGSQTLTLMEGLANVRLHAGKLGLGLPDLVAGTGRPDGACRIGRVMPEVRHGPRQAPHRPDKQVEQCRVDRDAGKDRTDAGIEQQPPGEIVQVLLQGSFANDHIDHFARRAHGFGPNAQQAAGRCKQDINRLGDMPKPGGIAQVAVDQPRLDRTGIEHQLVHAIAHSGHSHGISPAQQGPHLVLAQRPAGCNIGCQRSQMGCLGAVAHPLHAETGGGREIDQQHASKDQPHRDHQQLAGQAVYQLPDTRPGPGCVIGPLGGRIGVGCFDHGT